MGTNLGIHSQFFGGGSCWVDVLWALTHWYAWGEDKHWVQDKTVSRGIGLVGWSYAVIRGP
jgi:hypothetical protein